MSEVVEVLASQVKWGLDLVAWITDSLFELMNDDEFMSRLTAERSAEVSGYLEKRGDVALHLMLCSSSRCFLTALCRRLTHMDSLANKAMLFYRRHSATAAGNGSHSAQPEMQRAFHRVQQVSASALVRVTEFEKLVGLLGAGLSKAYGAYIVKMVRGQPGAPAQDSKEEEDAVKASRARLEMQMLVATGPPPGLWPVLHRFFTADLVAFRKATEPARLFFEPLSVMTAQDGGYWGQDGQQHVETVDGMRTTQIDVFTKNKIRMGPGRQWKRCTRCTSVMEEMQGKGAGLTFLLAQQRRCPCNGTLAVLPTGKLDFSG